MDVGFVGRGVFGEVGGGSRSGGFFVFFFNGRFIGRGGRGIVVIDSGRVIFVVVVFEVRS